MLKALINTIGYIFVALFSSEKKSITSQKKSNKLYVDDNSYRRFQNKSRLKSDKTYVDENGYRRFEDTDFFVHRWVAERKIGRKLKQGEVVHHINRNKLDNSEENLHVFPNQEAHDEQHRIDEEKYGFEFSYMGKQKKYN